MYESPSKSLESKSIIFQRFLWENILLNLEHPPICDGLPVVFVEALS